MAEALTACLRAVQGALLTADCGHVRAVDILARLDAVRTGYDTHIPLAAGRSCHAAQGC